MAVREKARLDAEDASKVAEKEAQITCMNRQIEELRRQAQQGSQQLQGDASGLELESFLCSYFPRALIEPAPNGDFGDESSIAYDEAMPGPAQVRPRNEP